MVLALVGCATPALAANSGAPDPQLLIGALPTYKTESTARAACPHDVVVWADRYTGTYHTPNEPQFATTPDGAFACRHDAVHGNYWDTDPLSGMEGRPGRNFPYQPLYPGS